MDKLDWKIRRFLVDEGYLFPTTDAEIERALKECEENPVTIIPELDNHLIYIRMCYCHTCKKHYHYLGINSHRAAHRRRRETCTITYTTGKTLTFNFG